MRKSRYTEEERANNKYWATRRSLYRRWWSYDPRRLDAVEAAKRAYKGTNKRQKWEYLCNICNKYWLRTQIEVDHITACGILKSKADEKVFRQRLAEGELQVLCKACHKLKTAAERRI